MRGFVYHWPTNEHIFSCAKLFFLNIFFRKPKSFEQILIVFKHKISRNKRSTGHIAHLRNKSEHFTNMSIFARYGTILSLCGHDWNDLDSKLHKDVSK